MLTACLCIPVGAQYTDTDISFIDVPGDAWYHDAVIRTIEEEFFAGTSGNTFSPADSMTRAMIATVLVRLADADVSSSDALPFTDVPAGRWYTKAVAWAHENGLIAGIGGGLFDPKSNITREQLCVILCKFDEMFGSNIRPEYVFMPFDDHDDIASWAEDSVSYLRMCGVTYARSGNTYSPEATLSRAEVAAMLVRFSGDYYTNVFDTSKRVMGVSMTKAETSFEVGMSEKLVLNIDPADADDKTVVWTSSDPAVAAVAADGTVTGVGQGYALITATARDGGFKASCGVSVRLPRVSGVTLSKASSELKIGESERLTATISPWNAADKSVSWTSSNSAVASVSADGTVTAHSFGTSIITVRTLDGGYTASCYYTIVSPRGIDPSKPMVAITFDDGPCKNTNRILDILAANGAVATFFEVGRNVNSYPDIVRRTVEMGNEIGSHSYDHPQLTALGYSAIRNQVDWTNNAFINAIGYAPTLFRPPYGSRSSSVDSAVNMPMILWSVDTLDWKSRNANSVYNVTMNNTRDGSIVLMHSLYTTTADALERILPALAAQGYQFVTVSELAMYRGYTLQPAHRYSSFY